MERTVRLTVADHQVRIELQSLLPGCQESWNAECWQRQHREFTASEAQIHALLAAVIDAELPGSAHKLAPPAPGTSTITVRIDLPATEPFHYLAKLQEFTALPKQNHLRNLILQLAGPMPETGGSDLVGQ